MANNADKNSVEASGVLLDIKTPDNLVLSRHHSGVDPEPTG
jgi:hypothetical protein